MATPTGSTGAAAESSDASGEAAPAVAASAAVASTNPQCTNCGEPHGVDDVFCENCGLDFLTGTLPTPASPVTSLGNAGEGRAGTEASVTITADRRFHQRMDTDHVLEFPEPEPTARTVRVAGSRVLVGRERPSRGIFPDIDLGSDPAASSRHALFERRADGTWTVTDLGSTNGTYVGDSTIPIDPNSPVTVNRGTPVFVGAWTRLDLD